MFIIENKNNKIIEYLGNQLYKFYFTKFLYYYRDDCNDYLIDEKEDLFNIDLNYEYIYYHDDKYYLYVSSSFDKNIFCRCQGWEKRVYLIEYIDNKLFFNEVNIEFKIDNFERIKYLVKEYEENNLEIQIGNEVDINNIIFQKLINPFLNKNFIESTEKELRISDNLEIDLKYKINLMFFYYENQENIQNDQYEYDPLLKFELNILNSYLIISKNPKSYFIYIEKFPPLNKNVIYYELDMNKFCCGTGEYFFYQIKHKKWLKFKDEELKKRKYTHCQECNEKLSEIISKDDFLFCDGDICNNLAKYKK